MKKFVLGIIAGVAIGCLVAFFLFRHSTKPSAPAPEAAAAPEKPKENPLHIPAAKRAAAGIVLVRPKSVALPTVAEAYGRVLDPSSLLALAAELQTAQAMLVASEKDAARLKKLSEAGNNASAQSREAAESAFARDQIAVLSARSRLRSAWGADLADDTHLPALLGKLQAGDALLRLDALPGTMISNPKKARVQLLGDNTTATDVDIIGVAASTDPQFQGQGFLGVASGKNFPVGAALRGELPTGDESSNALVIPRSSIIYHEGSAWVYVLGEEDTFERKIVTLGRSVSDGVVISTGIEPADQVVSVGAGQLLSAELQAGGAPDES